MYNWAHQLQHLLHTHSCVVMVTVVQTKGSTPREQGAKFFVLSDYIVDTIGGGNLEHQATKIARELLTESKQHRSMMKNFSLAAGLGMCCGGVVELLFEVLDQSDMNWVEQWIECDQHQTSAVLVTHLNDKTNNKKVYLLDNLINLKTELPLSINTAALNLCRDKVSQEREGLFKFENNKFYLEILREQMNHLYLFGAGHVGQALVHLMHDLPWQITWVDTRDDCLKSSMIEQLPSHINYCVTESPEAEIDQSKTNSFFLVMTHDHALDLVLCEQILNLDDVQYLGVIGSKTKRQRFVHRLLAKGYQKEKVNNIVCPIGIDGINSKHASAIALSVVAQLLQQVEIKNSIKSIKEPLIKSIIFI